MTTVDFLKIGATLVRKSFPVGLGHGSWKGDATVSQITVDTKACKKDGACIAVCPSRALSLNEQGFPEKRNGSCILCGHCVAVCPHGALQHDGLPHERMMRAPRRLPRPRTIDAFLSSRRSVREFKDQQVPKKTLEAILDVARRAPTATNSQKLQWLVVDGAEKVHELSAETIRWMHGSGAAPRMLQQWEQGYDPILRGAPVVIMACTPTEYEWGKQDCAIAVTFLELAAEARGLGICWAGLLTRVAGVHAPLRKLLSVPPWYTVHGGAMLGQRKYAYRQVPPRKPLSVTWV